MQVNVETLKAMRKQGLNLIIIQGIIAVLLVLLPNILPNGFIDFIGILIMIVGGVLLYTTINKPKEFTTWKSFIFPIVMICAGLFVFIYTQKTWTIIAWVVGVAIILKGIGTIFLKDSPVQKPRYKIFGIISVVIGFSMIVLANKFGTFLSYYIAIILIYHVVTDILIYLDLGKFIDSAGDSEFITITRD